MESAPKEATKSRRQARIAVGLLLLFFVFTQVLAMSERSGLHPFLSVASLLCWLGFAWLLKPARGMRIKLLLLPAITGSIAYLSTLTLHTDGVFGWSETLAKALFLSLLWMGDILRRRAGEIASPLSGKLFLLSELASLVSLGLVFRLGVPLPIWASGFVLGTYAMFALAGLAFLFAALRHTKADSPTEAR